MTTPALIGARPGPPPPPDAPCVNGTLLRCPAGALWPSVRRVVRCLGCRKPVATYRMVGVAVEEIRAYCGAVCRKRVRRGRHAEEVEVARAQRLAPLDANGGQYALARAALVRHAELTRRGMFIYCTPSAAEQEGLIPRQVSAGNDGKICYPTTEAAEAAARELVALGLGRQRAYLCPRKGTHAHLTHDREPPR